jgi:hypothetical protein
VKEQQINALREKHDEFLKQGLEPCDFGDCGFKFDYMLAETPRANIEAFVAKLGDRGWNSLFPEDAPLPPPPPPKPPKTPAKTEPKAVATKPPSK